MNVDRIETERFLIRKLEDFDIQDVFSILSDKETISTLNMDIHKSIDDTKLLFEDYKKGLKENTKFPYSIIEKNTQRFVGVFLLKLDLYNDNSYEFTIYLKKDYWGNGTYTEVLPHMIKIAFERIKTKNFRGYAKEKNKASIKVLSRSGFVLEKVFKVDEIEDMIYSYIITEEMYNQKIK